MGYASLIERHVLGLALQAAEERDLAQHPDLSTPEAAAAALAPLRQLVAGGRYPLLVRWAAAPSGLTIDEQFEPGLECLLDGIAARIG